MTIFVTGGAGYIGSIVVEQLLGQKHEVIVIDNLQEGNRAAVLDGAIFYEGDFGERKLLESIFDKHAIQVVIHFAAETTIEFSMSDPAKYFANNVVSGVTLLDVMREYECHKFIFSSTAATFGEPQHTPIDEKHPQIPINAYGESKLMFERILDWYHRAYGLKYNAFRYFNAAGASERLGEDHKHESHLIPVIIKSILGEAGRNEQERSRAVKSGQELLNVVKRGQTQSSADKPSHGWSGMVKGGQEGQELSNVAKLSQTWARPVDLKIFGNDYPTKDGTCVRDYVHVLDLAQAHILAIDNLDVNPTGKYNLGNGKGFTNLEVLQTVKKVSGMDIPFVFAARRIGDPAVLVASSELAEKELGWKPRYTQLETIVESAWEWHVRHPEGYGG